MKNRRNKKRLELNVSKKKRKIQILILIKSCDKQNYFETWIKRIKCLIGKPQRLWRFVPEMCS